VADSSSCASVHVLQDKVECPVQEKARLDQEVHLVQQAPLDWEVRLVQEMCLVRDAGPVWDTCLVWKEVRPV